MRKVFTLDGVLAAGAAAALMLAGCHAGDDLVVDQTDEELAGPAAGDRIPGAYIVVLRDDGVKAAADYGLAQAHARGAAVGVLARHGLPESAVDRVYGSALRGFSARMSEAQARRLASDPAVAFVEPDRVVTLLAPAIEQGDVSILAQTTPPGITRVGGGTNYTGSGRAWVIDTGIDLDHPDLNVDVARSRTFVSGARNPDDGNGHGTHVAGTIAAKNDSNGVVGVAAGAPVVAVQVLSKSGSGTTAGVIAGIDYVKASASNGDVANMSLGGGVSSALDSAVQSAASAGVKFALAAGNESDHANNHSPARANGSNIFTISAVNASDVFASFSNFGNPPVDFAAPGVSILSTYKRGAYATLSGTSMATPHVAGVLLFGNIQSDGSAINDPDGNPDPIAHR
jgi:subtilisin family serine protease